MSATDREPDEPKIALRAVAAAAMFARPGSSRQIEQWPPTAKVGPAPQDVFPTAPGLKSRH